MRIEIQNADLGEVAMSFADACRKRLAKKEAEGWEGWDKIDEDETVRRIVENLADREYVDVANLAMFLWDANGRKSK